MDAKKYEEKLVSISIASSFFTTCMIRFQETKCGLPIVTALQFWAKDGISHLNMIKEMSKDAYERIYALYENEITEMQDFIDEWKGKAAG